MGQVESIDKAKWHTIKALMQTLQESPGWDEYVKQLALKEHEETERHIAASNERTAGFVEGLRYAYHLPSRIIERVQAL